MRPLQSLSRHPSAGWDPAQLSPRAVHRDRPQPSLGRPIGKSATIIGSILITFAAPLAAQDALPPSAFAYRQLPDAAQEREAQALMETLRCLVCQGQSIADSDAALAGDMRSLVRQRIAAGESPEMVRQWLVDRYGDWVSYDPPMTPATWPLWFAPIALIAVGLWLAARKLRRVKPVGEGEEEQ